MPSRGNSAAKRARASEHQYAVAVKATFTRHLLLTKPCSPRRISWNRAGRDDGNGRRVDSHACIFFRERLLNLIHPSIGVY